MALASVPVERQELPCRVLIVEDSALARRVVTEMAEEAGWHTEAVSSGEEAFERCLYEPFDLVVSGVTMGGLSGVQLCRLLRAEPATQSTPVVLVSASDDPALRFRGQRAGADAHLDKETLSASFPLILDRFAEVRRSQPRMRPVKLSSKRSSPLGRVARILEEHLFHAAVAAEVRRLSQLSSERHELAEAFLRLLAQLGRFSYARLVLESPAGRTHAIYARDAFPKEATSHALGALGLVGVPPEQVPVYRPEAHAHAERITSGEALYFQIADGEAALGELWIFGGGGRINGSTRRTVAFVVQEVGLVVKSAFLAEETRQLADTDVLTKLPNRRRVSEQLAHEIERARRHQTSFSVALVDVDHFKSINDELGHNEGDEVLKCVASSLAHSVREIDTVGRWGGEEFLVLLPCAAGAGARIVAERLRGLVERSVCAGDRPVTASVGVATWCEGESSEKLVGRADEALYRAKGRGRNRVEVARDAE